MFDHQEELDQYLENIEALIKNKQYARLRDLFLPMEPADIALLLEEAGEEELPLLYRLLPKELAAEVFVELESDSQEMLINGFSNTELKEVLDELYLDDAVDIVEEMPASVVIRILDKATPEMRKSINEILQYPEDSAGSIMNMEFLSLKKDMTVEDAFKRIRRIGGELEMDDCYKLPLLAEALRREGFTEDGNLVTRDLLYDKATNKQFITVQTSGGNTFYIVIDYDKPVDEAGEQYHTYFLTMEDDAGLLAALLLAYRSCSLISVAAGACGTVLLCEWAVHLLS